MTLSVIITVSKRQNRNDVESLFNIYKKSIEDAIADVEFIYVTDDNSENMVGVLQKLQLKGERIKIVKIARWFGDATALNIGFEEASGDLILTLPPIQQISGQEITAIIKSFGNSDMIIAKRTRQKDNIFKRIQAKIFHYLVKISLGMHYQDLGCRVRLFRRNVLEHIHLYGDQIRFLPLLANKYGFKVEEVDVTQFQSDTKQKVYSLGHYTERMVDLISIFFLINFTKKPLRFFGFPGFIIFFVGALMSIYLLYERIVLNVALADRPIVLVSILLIVFGIQLFAIGLVAEIIIFTHSNSKEYIVEKVINGKKEEISKVQISKVEEEV